MFRTPEPIAQQRRPAYASPCPAAHAKITASIGGYAMSLEEDAWRQALRTKGRDWVLAELNTRPGLPQDPLLDVVYVQPFPTREFCQRWCVEADNQYLRLSGHTKG